MFFLNTSTPSSAAFHKKHTDQVIPFATKDNVLKGYSLSH